MGDPARWHLIELNALIGATMASKSSAPLEKALQRARALAPKLSTASDSLNQTIGSVECALKDLGLGVRASILLAENEEDGWIRRLVFSKYIKDWRLLIEEGYDLGDPEADRLTWEPLTNTARSIRLDAVHQLPKLLEAMTEQVELEINRVESAKKEAEGFINSLKGASSGGAA